jgi:hypothetical protein
MPTPKASAITRCVVKVKQAVKHDTLRAKLLLPTVAVDSVNVWQPESRQSQQGLFLRCFWLELFNPESLRAIP